MSKELEAIFTLIPQLSNDALWAFIAYLVAAYVMYPIIWAVGGITALYFLARGVYLLEKDE